MTLYFSFLHLHVFLYYANNSSCTSYKFFLKQTVLKYTKLLKIL